MHAWLAGFEGLLNSTSGQSRGTKPLQGGACRKATWLECTTFPLGQVHPQYCTLDPFRSDWIHLVFGFWYWICPIRGDALERFSIPWFLHGDNRVRAQVHVSAAALCIKTCMLPYSPKTRRGTDLVLVSSCVFIIL